MRNLKVLLFLLLALVPAFAQTNGGTIENSGDYPLRVSNVENSYEEERISLKDVKNWR